MAPTVASAAEPDAAAAAPNTREAEARERFMRGVALLGDGAVAEALAEFQRSRALLPTPKATNNIEVCLRRLGRFDEALDAVDALLADFPDLPAEKVRAAKMEQDEMARLVGALEIEGAPAGARLAIDGRDRGPIPASRRLRVSAGSRVLRVTREGFAPFEARVDVVSQNTTRLTVRLIEALRPAAPPPPAPPQARPEGGGAKAPPRRRARLLVELDGAALIAPTFGGPIAEACGETCSAAPGLGGYGTLRAGYTFSSGLALGLSLGGLAANRSIQGRTALIHPIGLAPRAVPVDDTIKLRGMVVGAWAGLSWGERVRVQVHLGGGALLGSAGDQRSGTFPSSAGDSEALSLVGDAFSAVFAFVAPGVRAGLSLGRGIELHAGLELPVLFAVKRPSWDASRQAVTSREGLVRFDAEPFTGAVIVAFAPGLGARYAF